MKTRRNSTVSTQSKIHSRLNTLALEFRAAWASGNFLSGCELARKALAISPKNFALLSDYALCLMRTEKYIDSYKIYKKIHESPSELRKDASDTWLDGFVEVCGHLDRMDEVRTLGKKALEIKDARHASNRSWDLTPAPPPFDTCTPGQNVISYSLYGAAPRYCETAVMNARVAPELFPGWICRFYADSSVPSHVQQRLRNYGAQVVNMDNDLGRKLPGTMWRFLVMDDPTVKRYLLRDADSLLSEREVPAVTEWISSGKHFHHIRDYFTHTELILAGLWGGCSGIFPSMREAMLEYVERYSGSARYTDQTFLRETLWATVRKSLLSHDESFNFLEARPFPPHAPVRWSTPKFHIGGNISYQSIRGQSALKDGQMQPVRLVFDQEEYLYEAPVCAGGWSLNLPFFLIDQLSSGEMKVLAC